MPVLPRSLPPALLAAGLAAAVGSGALAVQSSMTTLHAPLLQAATHQPQQRFSTATSNRAPDSVETTGDPNAAETMAPTVLLQQRTITIDGAFDDWSGIPPISEGAAPLESSPFIRIGRVWLAFDADWLYLSWEQSPPSNIQGLDGELEIAFDSDGQNWTGATVRPTERADGLFGVDFSLNFSAERRSEDGERGPWFNGVTATYYPDEEESTTFNPYAVEASFGPTYASERVEMRIRRGTTIPETDQVVFRGEQVAMKMVARNRDRRVEESTHPFLFRFDPPPAVLAAATGATDADTVNVETTPASLPLTIAGTAATPGEVLGRRDPDSTRFMSWNVLWGGPFENPDPYVRVINALQPDVICFQEMGREATAKQIRAWLMEHIPTSFGWDVACTPETGTAIATRLAGIPIGPERAANTRGERTLRSTMMLVGSRGGRRFAVANLHLKCCGRIGDDADQTRIVEAGVVQGLLARTISAHRPLGIVLMGDFNMVGSRTPLDILRTSNDIDGSDLLDVVPIHVGDTTSVTWSDPKQPFLPGRLDFALVGDAHSRVSKAFVLNTAELSEEVLEFNRLERGDTAETSDHFPVVVDLVWR